MTEQSPGTSPPPAVNAATPVAAPVLLLISPQPADHVFATAVAERAGMRLLVVDSAESAAPVLVRENVAAIFVDISSGRQFLEFDAYLADLQAMYAHKLNPDRVHLIASPEQLRKVSHYLSHPLLGNLIFRPEQDPAGAGRHYARTLRAVAQASSDPAAIGLKRLGFTDDQLQTTEFRATADKPPALARVAEYLSGLGCLAQVTEAVANAADELILNAIFDAPVNARGERIHRDLPRSTALTLAENHQVTMQLGFDGEYFGISVIDSAGSLDRKHVLAQITRLFRTKFQKVNESSAGAGVGISMIFRTGASFFFVSEPNSRTEVNVLFRRTPSFRVFRTQFQFIGSWVTK